MWPWGWWGRRVCGDRRVSSAGAEGQPHACRSGEDGKAQGRREEDSEWGGESRGACEAGVTVVDGEASAHATHAVHGATAVTT